MIIGVRRMHTSSPPPLLRVYKEISCVWNLDSELKREMQLKFTIKLNILQDTSTSVKLLLSPISSRRSVYPLQIRLYLPDTWFIK